MLEAPKEKTKLKNHNRTLNLALKMVSLKSSILGCYETGHAVVAAVRFGKPGPDGDFSVAMSLLALTLGILVTSHVKPTGLNLIDPRLTVLSSNHAGSSPGLLHRLHEDA